MEEMTNHRTNLFATKSGDSKEARNYQPIMWLKSIYKTVSEITRIISTTVEEQNLLPSEQKGCHPGSKWCKDQLLISKAVDWSRKTSLTDVVLLLTAVMYLDSPVDWPVTSALTSVWYNDLHWGDRSWRVSFPAPDKPLLALSMHPHHPSVAAVLFARHCSENLLNSNHQA